MEYTCKYSLLDVECNQTTLGNTQGSSKGLAPLSLIFLRVISEGYKTTTTKSKLNPHGDKTQLSHTSLPNIALRSLN